MRYGRGRGQRFRRGIHGGYNYRYNTENTVYNDPELIQQVYPEDIDSLKQQIAAYKDRIIEIQKQIDKLQNKIGSKPKKTETKPGQLKAKVVENRCSGCGICARVCPEGAITIRDTAYIDPFKCTGCGRCLNSCPKGAIILHPIT